MLAATDNYTLEVIDRISLSLSASKIYSIEDTPSLRATAILPRNITEVRREITFYGVALLVLLCTLLAVAVFRWMVVKPIMGLKADISSISNAMVYSLRASIKNNDEIGTLSREFNSMLGIIESNNTELLRLNAIARQLPWPVQRQLSWPVDLIGSVQRKSDMAARYGSEEFLPVRPGTDVDAAMEIAASIQEQIIAAHIEHDCNPVDTGSRRAAETISDTSRAKHPPDNGCYHRPCNVATIFRLPALSLCSHR